MTPTAGAEGVLIEEVPGAGHLVAHHPEHPLVATYPASRANASHALRARAEALMTADVLGRCA
jgi:hypothetical protein